MRRTISLLFSIVLCCLITSSCSSPSPKACSSQPTSLQFHWVCDAHYHTSTHMTNDDNLTYQGRPVCLIQPPVLTSQSFKSISDTSHDGILSATITLTDDTAQTLGKSTASHIGHVLAIVLKAPTSSKHPGHASDSACVFHTIVLNLITVHTPLDNTKLIILGWQSHTQIQQLIGSVKH